MVRTGNTIGAEGRRQHNEDDPQNGDQHRMQERLADQEIQEGLEEVAESRAEAEEGSEKLETAEQAGLSLTPTPTVGAVGPGVTPTMTATAPRDWISLPGVSASRPLGQRYG